ncbi:MAG: efflux RND transporter periplasmic adaptor subunit [Cellvibrionaceae bacterium]
MSVFPSKLPTSLLVLLLGGIAVIGVATLKPAPEPNPVEKRPPPSVSVVLANPSTQTLTVNTQGTVAPRREIDLVAEISGRITRADDDFVNGAFVDADQSLVTIDPRDYQLSLVRAKARVADAEQLLATERGRARQAKREWRELGNSESNQLFLRKPQLASAEAQLNSAKADRDKAGLDLERTNISVPFAGRVRETLVNLGQYVTPGTRIATVYDTSVAEIRLPLTDRQASLIDLPLGFNNNGESSAPQVSISGVIAGVRHTWQGTITRTDASIDTRTRLYYAVAEVKDPFRGNREQGQPPLVVGLFVEAQIMGRELTNVITVPKDALFKRNHIYTLTADNRVVEKQVTLLHSDATSAWISGEITAGEAIVVGKQSYISEGIVVAPQPIQEMVAGGIAQ